MRERTKRKEVLETGNASNTPSLSQTAKSGDAQTQIRWALHIINHQSEQRLQAVSCLENMALLGVPAAHYLLGRLNEQGMAKGNRRNIPKALVHYAIAARRGHAIANHRWQWLMALEGILWSRAQIR